MKTDTQTKCRAKDPSACPYHGAEQRMNEAAARGDFAAYEAARDEFEKAMRTQDEAEFANSTVVKDMQAALNSEKEVFHYSRSAYRSGGNGHSGVIDTGGHYATALASALEIERDEDYDIETNLEETPTGYRLTVIYTPDPAEGVGVGDPEALRFDDYAKIGVHPDDLEPRHIRDLMDDTNELARDSFYYGVDTLSKNYSIYRDAEHALYGFNATSEQREALEKTLQIEHVLTDKPAWDFSAFQDDYRDWYENYRDEDDEED